MEPGSRLPGVQSLVPAHTSCVTLAGYLPSVLVYSLAEWIIKEPASAS